MYFTINHYDTHERLGESRLSRARALEVLGAPEANSTVRRFVRTEWCVTAWDGDGSDTDEIIAQMNASEFVSVNGRVSGEPTGTSADQWRDKFRARLDDYDNGDWHHEEPEAWLLGFAKFCEKAAPEMRASIARKQ